jgi:hypothetical protein
MGILEEGKIENKSGRVTTPGRNYSVFFLFCVFLFLSCALHPDSLPSPPFFFKFFFLSSFLFFFFSFFVVAVCVLPLGLAGRD